MEYAKIVYVIENLELPIVKIGIASDLPKRLCQLIGSSGCSLVIRGNSYGLTNSREVEYEMHKHFSEFKKIGEWYNIKAEDAVEKLREIENKIGKHNDLVLKYLKGISISELARQDKCTRQNIIYKLKKYGVHENKPLPNKCDIETILCSDNNNIVQFNKYEIQYNDIKCDRNFKKISPNIESNGMYFRVKIYKNGKFNTKYFSELIAAEQYKSATQ